MKKITKKLLSALALILICGLVSSCTDERDSYNSPSGGDQEQLVSFSVRVPGSSAPDTYGLTSNDETDVKQIVILLFSGGNYTYGPIYSGHITSNPGDNKLKSFTAKIPVGSYDMVMLANSNAFLSTALPGINVGDAKATVLNKLLVASNTKWETNSAAANYIPIPMWGEVSAINVVSGMPTPTNLSMVRMLAKVDVALTTAAVQAKFTLESVRLYNYNDKGQIVPVVANLNATLDGVTAPSVPTTAVKPANPVNSPLLYNGAAITKDVATRGISCLDEIYTFESLKGTNASHLNNTCLVIGGKYNGETNETFYRVDFAHTTGAGAATVTTYLDILRNHNYKVNITNVSGSGLPTAEDAFKSRPVNIQATILDWDDGGMSDVVSDGKHILRVSQGEFTFTSEARNATSTDNTLTVMTDNPTGWKVEKVVDAGGNNITWLSLNTATGVANTVYNTKIVLAANATGATRTGFIYLNAGRLTYKVKVVQNTNIAFFLNLRNTDNTADITELFFGAAVNIAPNAQSLLLAWMPTSKIVSVSMTQTGTTAFVYGTSTNKPGTGTEISYPATGNKTLSIRPSAMIAAEIATNPFAERASRLDFTLNDGTNYVIKSLILRQQIYKLIVEQPTAVYLMNGTTYTLNVRSNVNWRIKSVTQSVPGLLALKASDNLGTQTGGGANTSATGTPVTFTVANSATLTGTLTIVFESTDNPQRFADQTVVINLT